MLKAFQNQKLKVGKSFEKDVKPVRPITLIYEKLIGGKMRKSGRATLVCCPIHGEQHPSCALYDDTNSFTCFSCGEHGDYINFVERTQNVDFKQALEIIKNL
ncbi:MAG: CHC2 zinc finger domain-containing protein [Candidatus Shapirobacteria bacterium]|nr:CHC2 zinc finger domain-containing protein [Candidatus Shapirobacteria bacterium]